MLLNCDMGESFGNWQMGMDHLVMPHIDQASIACGFHASDPQTMNRTIALAKQHQVSVGAHPGYQDLAGFGRRSIPTTPDELRCILLYQIGALQAISMANGVTVEYVKPHGALYNDMMANEQIFTTIVETLQQLDRPLKLMIQAGNKQHNYSKIAEKRGIDLYFEAFMDRRYHHSGALLPRSEQGAVLNRDDEIMEQIDSLRQGYLITHQKTRLEIEANTLCVHGDNSDAIALIGKIATQVKQSRA